MSTKSTKTVRTPSRAPSPWVSVSVLAFALALGLFATGQIAKGSNGQRTTASDSSQEAVEEPAVTLYATSWCGWCRKTRSLLTELDVVYREVDVENDPEGRKEFHSKTGGRSGVPVLDVAGTLVRGYNEKRIRRLLQSLEDAG